MLESEATPLAIATELNVIQEGTEDDLVPLVLDILAKWPQKVEEFKAGKTGIVGMFMGELMKATKGKADPKMASALVERLLKEQ
jgi:aspartyl-tRNA(Asn)/glutamyl-tRNA(Gln) amidotransferase subunit B